MPYSKTQRRPQRKYKRKYNKGPTNKTLAKKIKHIENDLIELKWYDGYVAPFNISVAGIQNSLVQMAQGDTASTRTGNSIYTTSVQLRLSFQSIAASVAPVTIRVILFWDKQSNGANPIPSGLDNSNSLLDTTLVTDTTIAPRNFNTIERYKIIWDKTFVINPVLATTTVVATGAVSIVMPIYKVINKVIKVKRNVKYDDPAGAITSIVTNNLAIAYFTDATANFPQIEASYRLYYKDA